MTENSVKYVPGNGFFGIQVLQNPIFAIPLPIPFPLDTKEASRFQRTLGAFGAERAHILL